jgi:hypothetical protein
MKFLCICQYGHSRSGAAVRVLHARGHEAVAAGFGTSPSALPALCAWADKIVVMSPEITTHVPPGYRDRVVVFNVGPDRYGAGPWNPELLKMIERMADEHGF